MAKKYSTSQMNREFLYVSQVTTCSKLEILAVWVLRESKRTLPDFCDRAAIGTFLIEKMNSWGDAIHRIKDTAITTGSLEILSLKHQVGKNINCAMVFPKYRFT